MRDLGRARTEALRALTTAPCRLNALLRRHALRDPGRATWGPAPLRWLSAVVCPTPAQQSGCPAYLRAVPDHTARLARLDQARTDQGQPWRLAPVVDALQALRGVQFTVAVTTVAELGDLTRFENPRQLMNYLGLTPSEYSTGERRQQGGITKTGNCHARRALVEGAWASRYPATVSRHVQLRLATQPKMLQDSSWQAHGRLWQRDRRLVSRGKHANVVTVAIARELAGFMWAIAREVSITL